MRLNGTRWNRRVDCGARWSGVRAGTKLNDVSFKSYHMFGSTSRILPGFTPAPEKKQEVSIQQGR
jgi:hypothetical protein